MLDFGETRFGMEFKKKKGFCVLVCLVSLFLKKLDGVTFVKAFHCANST